MKRILYYLLACLLFFSCKKMDSHYKKFLVPGGITYTQKASSPLAYSGRNRVKISWLRGTDPSVNKARIFWNNYTDSVEFSIPSLGDTISKIIDNLSEREYTFIIKTYNSTDNSSVPVELLSTAYGEKYQAGLLNRPVNKAVFDVQGNVTISWGAANITGGAYATEVKYTDSSNQEQILRFPITDGFSKLIGNKDSIIFQYRTVYVPETLSIDTFYTNFEEYE